MMTGIVLRLAYETVTDTPQPKPHAADAVELMLVTFLTKFSILVGQE